MEVFTFYIMALVISWFGIIFGMIGVRAGIVGDYGIKTRLSLVPIFLLLTAVGLKVFALSFAKLLPS